MSIFAEQFPTEAVTRETARISLCGDVMTGRGIDQILPHPCDPKEAEMASAILKDKDYDLISVIYHASQGCETARQYAADAEKEKDKEAAGFFNKALELNEQLVQKGKELLKQRL
jgi:hypothetical protein